MVPSKAGNDTPRIVGLFAHDSSLYGSVESRERYARLIAERAVEPQPASQSPAPSVADPDLTVGELVLRFYLHAKVSYGEKNKETYGVRDALRPVNELYGHARARDFGPKSLKVVRQHMIDTQDLCRNEVNRRISRIRRAFKWAESEELIPAGQCHALQTVTGLLKGRTEARESDPVKPVDPQAVEATLKFVAPPVAAMIRLQQLTGMRQGEVVIMRSIDIDRSGDVWLYQPSTHKTAYRGTEKQVPLGPQAQAVIQPFLDRAPDAFLFSPIEAETWRNERRAVHRKPDRKTKIYPCELTSRVRLKQARKSNVSKRPKRERYDSDSYRRAVTYGIQKAGKAGIKIPSWHPHRLRHSCGTEIRKRYGIEAAQVMLGHTTANVTEIYAERNLKLAVNVAMEMGVIAAIPCGGALKRTTNGPPQSFNRLCRQQHPAVSDRILGATTTRGEPRTGRPEASSAAEKRHGLPVPAGLPPSPFPAPRLTPPGDF